MDKALNKKQLRDRLDLLLGKIATIRNDPERKHPESKKLLEEYESFNALPYALQEQRRQRWAKYYIDVRETPAYALFMAQREAASSNNHGRVSELGREAGRMSEAGANQTVDKPPFRDPDELYQNAWIRDFRKAMWEISEIKKKLGSVADEEAEEVFTE